MQQPKPQEIPDKLFFRIGEVCEIIGVQPHVLRYWESEFPMLQPRKNPSGQRTYRRRDVEMALRIRQLLYDEGFTIAGAKRRLLAEGRSPAAHLQVVQPVPDQPIPEVITEADDAPSQPPPSRLSRETISRLRGMAEELLTLLDDTAKI